MKWKGYPDSENQWVNQRDMNTDKAIREYEEQTKTRDGLNAMRDKRRTQNQGTSSSPTSICMSSTSSSYHSTIDSPFIDNTIDLTADEDVSPVIINLTNSNAASPTVVDLTNDDDTTPITD